MATILPSGEELSLTPSEMLHYIDPDGLRQILRQERLHWLLKPNSAVNYHDNTRLFRYGSELFNNGSDMRMEIHTYPDNGAYEGFAGINIDSGLTGIPHSFMKWSHAISKESLNKVINRIAIGATAKVPGNNGTGLDDDENMSDNTDDRTAAMLFDPYDGRIYALTNDDTYYQNNAFRKNPLPDRTIARICDIPTQISQLTNDFGVISDKDYNHTDNNFTHSNRMLVDNMDDRTFVYPAIATDKNGNYIPNLKTNLDGSVTYHPGIFSSIKELMKVDLLHQEIPLRDHQCKDINRPYNYYRFDGTWSETPNNSVPQNPSNMETQIDGIQPIPYKHRGKLYQWRYNRVDTLYHADQIKVKLVNSGSGYAVGDKLSYVFGDDSFIYEVTLVGAAGQIQDGKYINDTTAVLNDDPSTHGRGVYWSNYSGTGTGATLAIECKPTYVYYSSQIKNNLYAYVNVSPTTPMKTDDILNNPWADVDTPDISGAIYTRSNRKAAYTGINSGRGGDEPDPNRTIDTPLLYEHGGNATAGNDIHLFHYVIHTDPSHCVDIDGVNVYTGEWVDMGSMGINNPADVKALFLSNPDTNNFNNYYKFMMDLMIDGFNRNPDAIVTGNPNAISQAYIHFDQTDPTDETRFTTKRIDNYTGQVIDVDVTNKTLYINLATGVTFIYNQGEKYDPSFPHGTRGIGWIALAGATTR